MVTSNSINNSTKVTSHYTAGSYTWTKDPRTNLVQVIMWSGGVGGGSLNGTDSGAGGKGGDGRVIVIEYF